MPRLIAGVDFSPIIRNGRDSVLTVVVILSFPELELIEKKYLTTRSHFPDIPGLSSFKDGPSFIKTWKRLNREPELVFFCGEGIAHERKFGIASHMGLWINRPTIGVTYNLPFGEVEALPTRQGEWQFIRDTNSSKIIGTVVKTHDDTDPVYVSPGNLITIDDATKLTLACVTSNIMPEPINVAKNLAKKILIENKSENKLQK